MIIPQILRIKITMISSKLTTNAQTTIAQPVRAALHLQPGDELVYEIDDQRVIATRASRGSKSDDPFRTFRGGSASLSGNFGRRLDQRFLGNTAFAQPLDQLGDG